jgi:hypothetical protein
MQFERLQSGFIFDLKYQQRLPVAARKIPGINPRLSHIHICTYDWLLLKRELALCLTIQSGPISFSAIFLVLKNRIHLYPRRRGLENHFLFNQTL